MYGTPAAVSASTTRAITFSALAPESIELPEQLRVDSKLVILGMPLANSCSSHLANHVAHLAGNLKLSYTTKSPINFSLNPLSFGSCVVHGRER